MPSISWVSGTPPQVVIAEEGTSQSFKAGDALQWTSGQICVGASTAIDGIARRDGANTTAGTVTEIELINLDSVYQVTYNTTIAQAIVGTLVDLDTVTAGAQIFHASGTTDAVIVGLVSPIGTASGGQVLIKFLAGVTKQA